MAAIAVQKQDSVTTLQADAHSSGVGCRCGVFVGSDFVTTSENLIMTKGKLVEK